MPVSPPQKALAGLVAAAVLAPSGHNAQPWRFALTASGIDLLADRSRRLPVADPEDRELTISCGAALFNMRAAAADAGAGADVDLLPGGGGPDLLARTTVTSDDPDPDLARLARAVPMRHTYRRRFTDRPVDPQVAAALCAAAAGEGARLQFSATPSARPPPAL